MYDDRVFEVLEAAITGLEVPLDGEDLEALIVLRDRLDARVCGAVADFDAAGRWETEGATSMTAWLADRGRMVRARAGSLARRARLVTQLPDTLGAWHDGALSAGQVEVIVANLDGETAGLFAEQEAEVVPTLVGLSAGETARVMRRWRELATADREPPPERPQALHLSPGLDGGWRLDANLDGETGEVISTALRLAQTDEVEGEPARSNAQRRADALGDICRHFLDHQQTHRGGRHRPHLNLILDGDKLAAGDTTTGETPGGTVIGPTGLQRLLCDSVLHRVVMRGRSAILDYGTATRTIPAPLWNALVVRDRGCRFPGCDRPVGFCEAHHVEHWTDGGPTAPANLVVLCSRHHHLLHQDDRRHRWQAKLLPDATFEVTDPTGYVRTTRPPDRAPPLPLPA